jgi:hypothetical protein
MDASRDGKTALLSLSFIVPNFSDLISTILNCISKIWSNKFSLLKFWCIKYAENPEKALEIDLEKDSYDR